MHYTKITSDVLFWGHDGAWWDKALIASLLFAFLTAGFVAVATFGSIFAHGREAQAAEGALERYKAETTGKVADASKSASDAARIAFSAGEQAGNAQSTSENAKADAARFQKEAAEANLQTERLKEQLSWRALNVDQRSALLAEASRAPGSVNIVYSGGDPEAQAFAFEFLTIFRNSGWPSSISERQPSEQMLFGVSTSSDRTIQSEHLQAVLKASRIDTTLMPRGGFFTMGSSGAILAAPTLMIGSKPRN